MEKIEKSYSTISNFSQHCDILRINDSFSNGRLYGYIFLVLILLIALLLCNVKENGKIKTLSDLYSENISNLFAKLIYCFLSCLIFPIVAITIPIFALLKQIANVILKLRYGNRFGGMLASADAVWAIEDISRNIINVLIILKPDPNRTDSIVTQIKDTVIKEVFQKSEFFPKLTSTRHRFMGYHFLLKNKLTIDDCITTLDFEQDKIQPDLQEIVSKCCNQELPKQHSALWQILVSPKPIQWYSEGETTNNKYPVLLRFSHIVGDGLSFTNLMLRTFASDDTKERCKQISLEKLHVNNSTEHLNCSKTDLFSKLLFGIMNVLSFLHILLMAPSALIHQHFLRKDDDNSLHGPELCGEKNLVYAVEDEHKLFTLVKDIKNSIPNCKFSDVLLAATSRSIDEHFKRNSHSVPRYMSVVIPALLSPPKMDQPPILENQFSVGILDLPIQMESSVMLKRLQKVMQQINVLRKSLQYKVNYWLITYLCGFIPHHILKESLNTNQLTMTVSNVPGVPKVTIMDDCEIEDIIFFTNHRGKTGVGFSILTYDDRFQLGLAIDKSIIASRNEAQMIIDDIFKYIKLLHTELCSQNISTGM